MSSRTVSTTVEQLLEPLQVGTLDLRARCTACGRLHGPGDPVTIYAYRAAEASQWDVCRLYCPECKTNLYPTLGTNEVLATARLGTVAVPTDRTRRLCLTDVSLQEHSGPNEGAVP